jgi:chromosome segregation ATPase
VITPPSPTTAGISQKDIIMNIHERHNYARQKRTPSPFVTNDSDDSPVIRRFTKGKRKNISESEENYDIHEDEPCTEKKKCAVNVIEASPPLFPGGSPLNCSTYTSTPLKQHLPLPKLHFDKVSPIKRRTIKIQGELIEEDSAKKMKTVEIDNTLDLDSENYMDNSFAYRDMTGDRIREYVEERNKDLAEVDVLKKTIDALIVALKKEKAMTEQLTNDKSILDDEKRDIERAHSSVKDLLVKEINDLKYEKHEQTKTFEADIKEIRSVLDDMKERKVQMQQANKTLSKKLAEREDACRTLHEEIAKMRDEKTIHSDGEKKRDEDQQKINDELKKEQQETENKNKALMDENCGYKMQIQEAVGRLQELNEDLAKKNELISQLKELNTAENSNFVQILEANQSNAAIIKNMQHQIEKLQEQSDNLMQQLSAKHVEIEAMKNKEQLDHANTFAKYAQFEKHIAHLNDDLQQKIIATKEASGQKALIESELLKEQNKVKMALEKVNLLQESLNKREEEHSEELKKRNQKINSLIDEHRRQGISRGNEKQLQDRIDEQDKELIAKLKDLDKFRHESHSQERTIEKLKQSFENEKQEKERLEQKISDIEERFKKSDEEWKKMTKETDDKYLNLETLFKKETQLHEDDIKTHRHEKADLNEELFQSKQKASALEERHSKLFGRYNTQFQECKELKYELDRLKKTTSETQHEACVQQSVSIHRRADQNMFSTTSTQTDVDKSKMSDSLRQEVSKIVKEFEERIPLSEKDDETCSFKGKQLHGVVGDMMKMIRSQWNTLLQNTDNFDVKEHIDKVFDRYATSVLKQTEEILSSLKSKEHVSQDIKSLRDEIATEKLKNTKLGKEKNRIENSLSEVKSRCTRTENELKKHEQDIVKLTKEKSEILHCNLQLKQEIESKHRKITDMETNLKSYMRNNSDFKVQLEEMKKKNKVTEGILEERDNEISGLKSTLSSGKQRYSMLKEQMDTIQKLQKKKKKETISKSITPDDDSGKIWIHLLNFLKKLHILPFLFQKLLNVHQKLNFCFCHQTH